MALHTTSRIAHKTCAIASVFAFFCLFFVLSSLGGLPGSQPVAQQGPINGVSLLSMKYDAVRANHDKAQLNNLRTSLDEEAKRRLDPMEWRMLTYVHQYWTDVSFGKRVNKGPPVAIQLKLHASIPPPTPTRVVAEPEGLRTFYQPSTWFEPVSALLAPELNASLVASQPKRQLMLAADVWFVDGCVRLISTPECSWQLDWRNMTIAVHGAWKRNACVERDDGLLDCADNTRTIKSDGPIPPSRVRT